MDEATLAQEHDKIMRLLAAYSKGAAKADNSIKSPSFISGANVFFAGPDGEPMGGGAKEVLFDAVDKDMLQSPDAKSAVVSVDILGTAASARVDTDDLASMRFTDFLHLLKIDGLWEIVSKAFYMHS